MIKWEEAMGTHVEGSVVWLVLFNRLTKTIHMACQQIKPCLNYQVYICWTYVLEIVANYINRTSSFFVLHSYLLVLT